VQGFFGKIPSLGDFVTRDLPREFLDAWDDWLQRSVAESKTALGDAWLNTYLHSPIWRFVLLPGVCGESGWAGILMPSVDKVGRYFPLTFASSLSDGVHPFQVIEAGADWFSAAEALALSVLQEDSVNVDTLQLSVAALDNAALQREAETRPILQGGVWGLCMTGVTDETISASVCHELVSFQVGSYSVWWTQESAELPSMGLVAPELPNPLSFAQLLAGTWSDSSETSDEEQGVKEVASAGEST
jgi:type VI secretion system protein ImpM